MNLNNVLKRIGLDQKERKTYLALLTLGEGTVKEVAHEAGLKRTHVYNILEDLAKKNLISKSPDAKRITYFAEHPKRLLKEISKTSDAIKSVLPDLVSLYGLHEAKPRVRLLEGTRGIEQAYDEALTYDKIDMCASLKNVKHKFDKSIDLVSKKPKKDKNTHIRDLLTYDTVGLQYAKKETRKNHEIRLLPKEFDFPIDCFMYGSTVTLFSLREFEFALIIENKDIKAALGTFFELAWRQGVVPRSK
ncbi:helix-turn-helix domain-containing protein [Patescibacteria group bacterium]|nr:helix-turn-helix domain-containing protein [Patescibacteria group bacterium]